MANVIQTKAEVDATGQLVYKAVASSAGFEVKVVDNEQRVLRFVISKEIRDRDGDIVRQRGIDTTNYQKNPVVFWGHQSWSFPIAKTIKLKKEKGADGIWLTWADAQFASLAEQGHAEAELAFALCRDGYVNAASQGFRIATWKQLVDALLTEDEVAARNAGQWIRGIDIVTSELYEWSPVGIPANPGAEIQRSGLVGSPDWPVKRVLDVAREKLGNGPKLEAFRRSILGPEDPICVGCVPAEKAPERFRALLGGELPASVEDDGFDLSEKAAPPAPAAKAADPEPEDTDPPVAPVAKGMGESTAGDATPYPVGSRVMVRPGREHMAEHVGLGGTVAEVNGTAIAVLFDGEEEPHRWYVVDELTPASNDMATSAEIQACISACRACVEACRACVEACAQMMDAMKPAAESNGAEPMSMASFAAEVRKTLADHATQVERIQVEVWALEQRKALDTPKTKSCGCTKAATTAPAEATPDPAPVAKDANTPASAEVPPSPSTDPGLMERVLRAGFTAGREKHLGIVRL